MEQKQQRPSKVGLLRILRILSPIVLLLITLALASAVLLASGVNPSAFYGALFIGAFGNLHSSSATINLMAVLLLTGLSTLVAFKANIWNIGEEGQLYLGAIGGTVVGLMPFSNATVHILAVLVMSVIFGSFWGLIPAVLKIALRIDEIVSTVLLNYIALLLVDYLVSGPIRDPHSVFNESPPIQVSAWMPQIGTTGIGIGIIIALVLAGLCYFMLQRTTLGWEIRVLGGNLLAAKYSGVPMNRTILLSMIISGGLSGLGGGVLLAGGGHILLDGISAGYGYVGIGVAALADFNPLAAIPSSTLFSIFVTGSINAQATIGVPYSYIQVLVAILILALTARAILVRRFAKWLT